MFAWPTVKPSHELLVKIAELFYWSNPKKLGQILMIFSNQNLSKAV